jgi:hypothetical protein
MSFCFEVRFRTSRPILADRLEKEIKSTTFKQPLRFWRPFATARDENWLAIQSCGFAAFDEAEITGTQLQDSLLIHFAKTQVGVEFVGRGAVRSVSVFSKGLLEISDPGAPLPIPLKEPELIEIVTAAADNASTLTANQRVAAALLNDSFFQMSPEARFLLRVSAVEALCPQAGQTEPFRMLVEKVKASIPVEGSSQDRNQIEDALKRIAGRQSVRSAYMSKIKLLLSDQKAKRFEALYGKRSDFLHDGRGRGVLGEAANITLEICLELLLADIAQSTASPTG